jgi:hypothetical protein
LLRLCWQQKSSLPVSAVAQLPEKVIDLPDIANQPGVWLEPHGEIALRVDAWLNPQEFAALLPPFFHPQLLPITP